MKITSETMSKATRDFKLFGTLTCPLLMRRLNVSREIALEICKRIEKRFPNLWKDREAIREKKWIENMRP